MIKSPFRIPSSTLLLLVLVSVIALVIAGCSQQAESPVEAVDNAPGAVVFSLSDPGVVNALAVQENHTPRLLKKPGIVGTAVGATKDGEPAILVLVENQAAAKSVAPSLDGIPVTVLVTGKIKAYKKPSGVDHTARQTRPIQLGVSGGNAYDLANGYCCSGTLGALVVSGSTQYILSNSHVFAGDIASSATDPDVAQIGDPINQPGLIDVYCQDIEDDYVANLSTLSSLTGGTNVDCSMAEVIEGMVRTDGSILEIGTISSSIVGAYIGQPVKKSGRTTGLTRSTVSGLNASVNVGYGDECAGESFTILYTGQILVSNRANKFLNSGDSGSLMVEDVDTNPHAVGLLYAGGGGIAVANPIDDVLDYLGVQMVGN